MTEQVAAVKRGAKLLDKFEPTWAKKVNLKKFNIADTNMCVLGQVHQEFARGLQDLATKAITKTILSQRNADIRLSGDESLQEYVETVVDGAELDGAYYGFDSDGSSELEPNEEWEHLGSQWVKEITRRKKK